MRKHLLQIFIGILFPLGVYSQAQISNVKFNLNESSKTIEIDYDIDYNSPEDSVYVGVVGKKSSRIKCTALSGDIGKGIKTGSNKHIYWNVIADSLMINEEIAITVFVKLHNYRSKTEPSSVATTKVSDAPKPQPTIEPAPQSTPIAKTTPKPKPVKQKGSINKSAVMILSGGLVAGIGMVVVSTQAKSLADQYYDEYKKNNINQTLTVSTDDWLKNHSKLTIESANKDLALARSQQKTANLLFYGGIALTALDLVYSLPRLRNKSPKKLSFQPVVGNNGTLLVNLNLKF